SHTSLLTSLLFPYTTLFRSAHVSVLLGNGDGTFQAAVNFGVGIRPAVVTVGDFNGDGIQDLAVANNGSNNVSVLLGNGDGTFQRSEEHTSELQSLTNLVCRL